MRKFLIPAAILASTIATVAPAAAQWAPQNYGYNNGYNQQGYNNGYGQARALQTRVAQLRQQIWQLARRNILSDREARQLNQEVRGLDYRVRQASYNGLDGRESYALERQIAQLEWRIRREANDGNRRPGYGNGYNGNGYGNAYNPYDRDRDGRDDRYEDDRGREHDRGDHRGDRDDN